MNGPTILALAAFVIFIVIFGPLLTIWAINTLFGLSIAFTFKTWAAALVLGGLVGSTSTSSKK